MVEHGEISLTQLAKRVDDQARFTRSVVVVCTLAVLGLNFYMLTEMFSSLPSLFVLQYLNNLEKIVTEWKLIEISKKNRLLNQALEKDKPAPAPAPAKPAE